MKKLKNRLIAFLLFAVVCISLAAFVRCGKDGAESSYPFGAETDKRIEENSGTDVTEFPLGE